MNLIIPGAQLALKIYGLLLTTEKDEKWKPYLIHL